MKFKLMLLLLAAAVLSGCSHRTINTVERADPIAQPNLVNDKRIITDSSLARALAITQVNESVVGENLLRVQVVLENRRSVSRAVRYRFEWVGEDGMMLSSPTGGWRTITLRGRESGAVSATATNPRAVDFVLKLQET